MMGLLQPRWIEDWRISRHVGLMFNPYGGNLRDQLEDHDYIAFISSLSARRFSDSLERQLIWRFFGFLSGVLNDELITTMVA